MTTTATAPLHLEPPVAPERALGKMATTLVGSEILRIAGEVRALQAQGKPVLNLMVGDFAPKQFRIPAELEAAVMRCLHKDTAQRFGSAAELARALAPFATSRGRGAARRIAGVREEDIPTSSDPVTRRKGSAVVGVAPPRPPFRQVE